DDSRWHRCLLVGFAVNRIRSRMTAHGNQVNCHGKSDERQENGDNNGLRGRPRRHRPSTIQLLHQPQVMPRGKKKNEDSDNNERGSEPERQSVGWGSGSVLDYLELPEEKAESRHNETEAHQRQTGANPGQKSTLSRQQVTQVGPWGDLRRLTHLVSVLDN